MTRAVSIVAANPGVRDEMRRRQREWAEEHGGGVVEGRDIGTVVFPDADLKVYLDASPTCGRLGGRRRSPTLATRPSRPTWPDATPSTRDATTARCATPTTPFAIDTSDLSVEQIVERVMERLR